MNILYFIPARGGSKGIPGKNLAPIAGIPLVAYRILSALKAGTKGRILCSTDSAEIAAVAKKYGAEAPFLRPAELSSDDAPTMGAILHGLDWVETRDRETIDAVMLLEPTTPFTTPDDLDRSIELFRQKKPHSVIGVRRAGLPSCFAAELGDDGRMDRHFAQMKTILTRRRQEFTPEYVPNGALFLVDRGFIRERQSLYGENSYAHIMPDDRSIDIDTPDDLRYARYLADQGLIDLSCWR